MDPQYRISLARPEDVPLLGPIEWAAAQLLKGYAPDSILDEVKAESELSLAQQEGRLWVALQSEVPVGFALCKLLAADLPHLEEIDVHPQHGRRGIGTALVRTVCAAAAAAGHREITLTTFRGVPWNMPFYARLGFVTVAAAELRPELLAVVDDETGRGLDPSRRVVMKFQLTTA